MNNTSTPIVGLTKDNIIADMDRFSALADAVTGEIKAKCMCHRNVYSNMTHALCKNKCAKLARKHVLHAALSRKYLAEYFAHLDMLTKEHEKQAAIKLAELKDWNERYYPMTAANREDILNYINSPDTVEAKDLRVETQAGKASTTEYNVLMNKLLEEQSGTYQWTDDDIAVIPDDVDDDFVNAIQLIDNPYESPITFFESIGGHLEELSMLEHFNRSLTEQHTGYGDYLDAVQLMKPHLRGDIMDYILYCTGRGSSPRSWEERLSLADLITESRAYFCAFAANKVTARLRMGYDDRLETQGGKFYAKFIARTIYNSGRQKLVETLNFMGDPHKPADHSNFVENLLLYLEEYRRCRDPIAFMCCYYKYLKMQFGICITRGMYSWISEIIEPIFTAIKEWWAGDVDLQSGIFGDFVDTYKSVTQSSIFEKLTKLSVLIGSLAMFWASNETLTLLKFNDICGSVYSGLKTTDVFGQVLETMQAIYTKCIPIMKGDAPFASIWQGLGDGRQLDLDIVTFIGHANKYCEGTADDSIPAPEALLVKSKVLLDKLTLVIKATPNAKERVFVQRTMLQVESLRNAINNKHTNAGIRAKPYTISLFGTTGVGKTCLSFELAILLQKALGIDAGSQYIFRYDEQEEYQSSLTVKHNTYIMDDVGNTKPESAKVITTEPIIAFSNNCPKFAIMADLASKGVVAMKPKTFILTTNVKELHAGVYSVAPDAVLRRVERHITVKVKPEYADINGQLRQDVDPLAVGFDCWIFTVQKFSPNTTHAFAEHGFEPVVDDEGTPLIGVSFAVLCRHLVKDVKKHHERQDAYVLQTERAHLETYCACGIRAIACDRCPKEQSGVMSLNNPVYRIMGAMDVWKYPVGRSLLYQSVRGYRDILLEVLLSIYGGLLATYGISAINWGLYLLFGYLAWCAYRICTFKVTLRPVDACQAAAKSFSDAALGTKAKILAGLFTMCGVYLAYNRLKQSTEQQGSTPSRPRVEFTVGNLPDTWKRVEVAPLPTNPEVVTTTGVQLADMIAPKLCSLRVFTDTTHEFAATFPICTNFWIVPLHVMKKDYEKVKIIHASEDVINFSATAFREGSYRQIGETDFALLYMPGKGDQLDIIKYFPTKDMFKNGKMQLTTSPSRLALLEQKAREVDGRNVLEPTRSVHGVRVTSGAVCPKGVTVPYWGGSYISPVPTFTGMCGCPIVSENSGPYFVGLHSAGVTGTTNGSYGTVMREELLECLQAMTAKDTPMMQGSECSEMHLGGEAMPFSHTVPVRNHVAFMEEAEVDVLGCHAGRKRRYTSMVQATDYSDDIEELFHVARRHGKPALMNHWYPARLWLESCANAKPVHNTFLGMAYSSYKNRVFNFLKDEHKDQICVLEDVVNTSGLDGVKGLYKMNYAASAGIPYCKPKRDYVKESLEFFDGITVPYELTPEMMADVKLLEDIYKSGRRGYAPHRANRKDEAIKLEKAKVRIFSGTSMPYLFLMRKYFLSISVFMQQHPEVFESAVGTNPYSKEWTRLYEFVTKYGVDRMIAGDYEKYDQFVHSMLTYAGFKVLIAVAEWAGFDEEDLMVMRGLATDTCNPVYELDGLWVKLGGSSPSGHGLTVVLNGIVNSFYARIAYYMQRKKLGIVDPLTEDFNQNVAFMSYGDDNLMSVHERASFFNHCTYQEALRIYGLNYTMADKTAVSVPYINMSEATFLKRSWVWSDEYKKHMAPLEKESIFKMLHTFTVSKVAPRQQQLADILRSANQEFFMHGDDVYEDARPKLMQIAKKYEVEHYLPSNTLPTLTEMKEWYVAME